MENNLYNEIKKRMDGRGSIHIGNKKGSKTLEIKKI
jgi:hypothetical protein